MDVARLISSLERGAAVLDVLARSLSVEEARWKPDPASWSIHEIACHLLDEETRDFRPRIEATLRDPGAAWEPIDPEGWVAAHGYATRDLDEVWRAFQREREASIAWLRGLRDVDWSASHDRGDQGRLSAGDLLASWAAHDLLHVRQVARRLHQRIEADAAPHSPAYAGPWR